ncbi:MAG: AAA family ATPase [Planctomycetes bacterium]|nr:AAA family ATPase [Planctomycetota bacterium]MCW8137089.1 AAA family ATPase [Planctomycetota bacterium]
MSIHHSGLAFAVTPERVIRTHANTVLLVGDVAYKLKKPVKYPFLDYSTLALRRRFVQAEYDLNHRFSPDIYLGVCEVLERDGSLVFGPLLKTLPESTPADYAVVMRRIPDDAWLPRHIQRGLSDDDLAALMQLLTATWAAHPADEATRAAGMPENLRHNTVANIAECERFVPHCLSRERWHRLDALLRGWFEAHADVFEARVAQDRIRDGHGDLKPGNIAFIDGKPVVTDCIEFNPQFRRLDTLAEAAFLATGLEQLGHLSDAARVFAAYRKAARDEYPEALRRYYQAHLACVIGKVTALQLDDPEIGEQQRQAAVAAARQAFALADFHAREPHVVVVAGIMGCGKSTVAAAIGAHFGWPVVNSDVVRKRLMGVAPEQRLPAQAYTDDVSARVYGQLYAAAREAGAGVVLDGQFPARSFRAAVVQAARQAGGRVTFVLCDAPDDVVRMRMRKRVLDPSRVSDATEELLAEARKRFEPVGDEEGMTVLRFDTTRPTGEVLPLLHQALMPDYRLSTG